MSNADSEVENARPKLAIATPLVDVLCCGGFSIILIGGYLLFTHYWGKEVVQVDAPMILFLTALFNWPHFMASYRILYRSPKHVFCYPWASIYVPAILVLLTFIGTMMAESRGEVHAAVFDPLVYVAMYYLAWHYTGQAWGMTASFAHIAGVRMDTFERFAIRTGFRALLIFHLAWLLVRFPGPFGIHEYQYVHEELAPAAYGIAVILVCLSFPLGLFGFFRIWRRTGQLPPWRALLPWMSHYLWYLLLHVHPVPLSLGLLQISHAVQYITFPIRVEVNRYRESTTPSAQRIELHVVLYYAALIITGIIFFGPDVYLKGTAIHPAVYLITIVIQIHHYFVDGCIWKISNPEVRKDLFAHLAK